MELARCPSCSAPVEGDRCVRCGAAVRAGRYQVLGVLASSRHGRTYRASGPAGLVALKELVFALVPTVEQLDAFEREARVLAALSHPSIPRFVESFRAGEGAGLRLYLAQELVEGEPLSARLGGALFTEDEARELARQTLEILQYLHAQGVVHRDVKPANLIRRTHGSLALVDYGAARAVEGVTHGATLVGTYGYMPPEQLGGTVDATSDLYALGATLVHLLGAVPPANLLGPELRLGLDHLRVSPGFRRFLARLTASHRSNRPRSAALALEELRDSLRPSSSVGRTGLVLLGVGLAGAAGLAGMLALASQLQRSGLTLGIQSSSRIEHARRLQEALEAIENPPPPKPPPATPKPESVDISLGRLLSGKWMKEADPELPDCFRQVGLELARVRIFPREHQLQLKVVLHSQNACDWIALSLSAQDEKGATLAERGAMADGAREGWREILYNFSAPPSGRLVRFELSGPGGPLEAWRVDLESHAVRRAGYAVAGTFPLAPARVGVQTPKGCAEGQARRVERFWLEHTSTDERKLHAVIDVDTPRVQPGACGNPMRLRSLTPGSEGRSVARDDGEGRLRVVLDLPAHSSRIRVALEAQQRLAVFRLDLDRANAEHEGVLAVAP